MQYIDDLTECPELSPETLLETLNGVLSPSQDQIKICTIILQSWEKREGYHSLLQVLSAITS